MTKLTYEETFQAFLDDVTFGFYVKYAIERLNHLIDHNLTPVKVNENAVSDIKRLFNVVRVIQ